VTWNENFSRAWKQNQDFYRAVYGYEYDDMSGDGFEYATFSSGGAVAGGIGQIGPDMPAEMPPHWSVYFKVADVDAAVADDQGAHFMVMADPR